MWSLQAKETAIIQRAEQVFCKHILDWECGFSTEPVFNVVGSDFLATIYAKYDAPVRIDAGNFNEIFLIKHCLRGWAEVTQAGETVRVTAGQTVVLSANKMTSLSLSADFVEQTIKIHASVFEQVFYEEYGAFLPSHFSFSLQLLHKNLLVHVGNLSKMIEAGLIKNNAYAEQGLAKMLCSLLLRQHVHNYKFKQKNTNQPLAFLTKYIQEHSALALTMPHLEQVSQLSQRSIQLLFKTHLQLTPMQYLRQIRLNKVRAILQTTTQANISAVALQEGFGHLGRFSHYYEQAFNEQPQQTLKYRV